MSGAASLVPCPSGVSCLGYNVAVCPKFLTGSTPRKGYAIPEMHCLDIVVA